MSAEEYEGPDLGEPIIGASDETEVNLKEYAPEDWVTLVFFWILGIVVFLQFFTRYALNDSLAWTEEIARYLLSCVAFLGGGMAVRKFTHIHVEFLYVYYPRGLAHFLSTLVDFIRVPLPAARTIATSGVARTIGIQSSLEILCEWIWIKIF